MGLLDGGGLGPRPFACSGRFEVGAGISDLIPTE
jgi:hypothetical protein